MFKEIPFLLPKNKCRYLIRIKSELSYRAASYLLIGIRSTRACSWSLR